MGKVSLIRRAKSAVSRTTLTKKTNDKHPLFHVAWEAKEKAQQAQSNGIANDGYVYDENEYKPAEEDIVTVEEVKRHMEQFHMRKCTPPHSAKIMDEKTGKYVKQRRTKTARNKYVNIFDYFIKRSFCYLDLN